LPSASRLRRKSDFGKVYGKGRSYATDLIVMYVLPRRDSDLRVGFSVSGKLGKSVARNRTRRLLQEAARLLLPRMAHGFDVVVSARAKAAGKTFEEFARDLEQLAQRFGLIREDAAERQN
jgi:ribonuclease P protein component